MSLRDVGTVENLLGTLGGVWRKHAMLQCSIVEYGCVTITDITLPILLTHSGRGQ